MKIKNQSGDALDVKLHELSLLDRTSEYFILSLGKSHAVQMLLRCNRGSEAWATSDASQLRHVLPAQTCDM